MSRMLDQSPLVNFNVTRLNGIEFKRGEGENGFIWTEFLDDGPVSSFERRSFDMHV